MSLGFMFNIRVRVRKVVYVMIPFHTQLLYILNTPKSSSLGLLKGVYVTNAPCKH